jgi:hypothetical protein
MSGRARLRTAAAALATAAIALGATAAWASAAGAGAYLQADLKLVSAAAARIPRGESILSGLLAQVRRECPHAAAGSPQDSDSTELSNEVIGTMVISAIRPILPQIHTYLGAVVHLQVGAGSVQRELRSYVTRLRAMAGLTVPALCADVRSWAAGGYRTLSAATTSFSPRFLGAWVAVGVLPAGLSRTEGSAERALAARAGALESALADFEARAVETWGEIMSALELNP